MGIRRQITGVLTVLILGIGAAVADAGPLINGSFSLSTFYRPVDGETGATATLGAATGIDFVSDDFEVEAAEGDFASLLGETGAIKDFSFLGAGSASFPTLPISGFQSLLLGGLTFDLNEIAIEDRSASILHLVGTGLFNWSSAGFETTAGTFDFYATRNGFSAAFNSAEGVNPVPEPGSIMLLGSGVIAGIGSLRRRFRKA